MDGAAPDASANGAAASLAAGAAAAAGEAASGGAAEGGGTEKAGADVDCEKIVFVSCMTGFLGSYVVRLLLGAGYKVRGVAADATGPEMYEREEEGLQYT